MSISLGERVRKFFKRDYSYSFPPGFTSLLEEIEADYQIAERVKSWNSDLREGRTLCSDSQREMCLACSNFLLGIDQERRESKPRGDWERTEHLYICDDCGRVGGTGYRKYYTNDAGHSDHDDLCPSCYDKRYPKGESN